MEARARSFQVVKVVDKGSKEHGAVPMTPPPAGESGRGGRRRVLASGDGALEDDDDGVRRREGIVCVGLSVCDVPVNGGCRVCVLRGGNGRSRLPP